MASGGVGGGACDQFDAQADVRPLSRGPLHGRRLNAIVGGLIDLGDQYRSGGGDGDLPFQVAGANGVSGGGEKAVSEAGGFADRLMSEVGDSAAGRRRVFSVIL